MHNVAEDYRQKSSSTYFYKRIVTNYYLLASRGESAGFRLRSSCAKPPRSSRQSQVVPSTGRSARRCSWRAIGSAQLLADRRGSEDVMQVGHGAQESPGIPPRRCRRCCAEPGATRLANKDQVSPHVGRPGAGGYISYGRVEAVSRRSSRNHVPPQRTSQVPRSMRRHAKR